ncbi:hypothetical protein V1514DRAFT_335862 [Lipomyces japonicus]|uniref:uncharacterized protein n=1 Tax=Lipomyces japonicus TaxID=56871 RepID=UPI0034CE0D5F
MTVDGQYVSSNQVWQSSPVFYGSTKFQKSQVIRNILITGGAGFIASWICRHLALQYEHYNVVCFDRLDYCASLNNIAYLVANCPNFTFVKGDITSPAQVSNVLSEHKIDTVLHLAALSHVDLSFGQHSFEFTSVNVYGTHVLLESCKDYGNIKRFVHMSTDEVYGEVHSHDTDLLESAILSPTNPYAATKAASDMIANAYFKSFHLPIIIVRCNNVYGAHQFPEKIIPKFVCLLQAGKKCLVHGDGSHTRRYIYAGDAVDAVDTVLHKGVVGQIYNIGTSDEISNLELCKRILQGFGYNEQDYSNHIQHTNDRPFNDRRYAIDASRLRDLGWLPKTSLHDGLKQTIEWYRNYGQTWWGDVTAMLTAFPKQDHMLYRQSSSSASSAI